MGPKLEESNKTETHEAMESWAGVPNSSTSETQEVPEKKPSLEKYCKRTGTNQHLSEAQKQKLLK